MDNKTLFLSELSQLSIKYKIYITGCGCCGSPFIVEDPEECNEWDADLKWNKEKQEYEL